MIDGAEKARDRWVKRLLKEFLQIQGWFPFKALAPEDDCPKWVTRVHEEYAKATVRGSDLLVGTHFTPKRLGAMLGHQCAYAVWMVEAFERLFTETSDEALDVPGQLSEGQVKTVGEALKKFELWYSAMRRFAGRALKSAVYQSYDDMSAFLLAFGDSFGRKPRSTAGIGDFGSTTFAIYHLMLLNWRVVDRLASVRELHDWLRRHLGEYRTGDLKRVEKLCQRVDLHYRKAGRPKKLKDIQTSA
jgi:hypothetical protein